MPGLVFIWGLDFVAAKKALVSIAPLTLVFFKYVFALLTVYILKRFKDKDSRIIKKDLRTFMLCAVFGQFAYSSFGI